MLKIMILVYGSSMQPSIITKLFYKGDGKSSGVLWFNPMLVFIIKKPHVINYFVIM
jgi:hypothetical protein